jgi:hypothetical protein
MQLGWYCYNRNRVGNWARKETSTASWPIKMNRGLALLAILACRLDSAWHLLGTCSLFAIIEESPPRNVPNEGYSFAERYYEITRLTLWGASRTGFGTV